MIHPKGIRKGDRQLLFYIIALIIFGLLVLTSASSPIAYSRFGDSYFFVKRQIYFGLLPGIILFLITSKIDYIWWKKLSWIIYAIVLVLLSLIFVNQIGMVLNGSRSWLVIGGFSFQPGEVAKLGIIIILAAVLSKQKINWNDWQSSILPILACIVPILILIALQPDIGTLSIIVCIIFFMLYMAHMPNIYLALLGLVGIIMFIILILAAPYRMGRLTTFLHPELDPKGKGYQVNQAFLAVGSGGFFGLGFGQSRQKFQYLPEVHADSIFAVLAEELGFIFSAGVIVLILFIGSRGLKIASYISDEHGRLLITGIIIWFVWQSFLNIGAMVGALPLTGVPLPLVSHGGSAYMTMLAALGIVLNISKQRVS